MSLDDGGRFSSSSLLPVLAPQSAAIFLQYCTSCSLELHDMVSVTPAACALAAPSAKAPIHTIFCIFIFVS